MRALLLAVALLVATAQPALAAPTPLEAGTPLVTASGARCANGFSVHGHLLVSPACGRAAGGALHHADGRRIGTVVAIRRTHAVVRIDDTRLWQPRPTVAGRPDVVTGSTEAPVGAEACVRGPVTGWRCTTVASRDSTLYFGDGSILHGVSRIPVCSPPNDDWGAVVSGTQAQGLVFVAHGCPGGTSSFFFPLVDVLAQEGLRLVTG